MSEIINTAKDCSIRAYMAAGFDDNLKVLIISGEPSDQELLEAFEAIHEEYMELSGSGSSGDYILIKQVKYLRARLESIYNFIKIHRTCIAEIGEPFHPAIADLKKLGHKLNWDPEKPDVAKFLKDLDAIKRKERRTESELMNKLRALEVLQEREKGQHRSQQQQRIAFVAMVNNLGKAGYRIDKDKTSMEELGLMTRDYLAELEALNNKKRN